MHQPTIEKLHDLRLGAMANAPRLPRLADPHANTHQLNAATRNRGPSGTVTLCQKTHLELLQQQTPVPLTEALR